MAQPLTIRLTHWVNVVLIGLLIGSGLQIFDAHPTLYWADASHADRVLFALPDFPQWVTVGGWLAGARRWHLAVVWPFVLNGVLYLAFLAGSGEGSRRLFRWRDAAGIPAVLDHYLKGAELPEGDGYNALQRLSYTVLVCGLAPLLVLTGLAMAPAMDARWPWLPIVFGGRQFARTWHFALMAAFVLFVPVHVALVARAGWPTFAAMVTGGPKGGARGTTGRETGGAAETPAGEVPLA